MTDTRWTVTAADPAPCWMCRASTRLVSLAFEAPMCGLPCEDAAWQRYIEEDEP